MKQNQNFTQGPILPALLKFALPVLLALLLQAMYGAVDLQVVGKFGTAADISAVATGSQIMHSLTIIVTGLSMGITVLLGQKIGEGKPREAGGVVGSGICLFSVVTLVMTAAVLLAAPKMAEVMHAPADAFAGTVSYVRICGAGSVFIIAYNLLGSIFRGLGDSKMPLLTVLIACVLNIIGDLLLVAGVGMGVAGAAIATVFAQAVSVLLSLLIIRRRELPFTLTRTELRPDRSVMRRILRLGTPIALQDLLVSVSFLVITAIANGMGVVASAGVGVAEKLCGFVMLVPSAYMQSMSAFVAQNIGAGREDRAQKALWTGILSSLVAGVVMAWAGFFRGDVLAGFFAEDPAVVLAGWEYLKSYAIDCLFTSFLFCFVGYFNGRGQTVFVMVQGFIGAFCVRLPVALLVSSLGGSLFQLGLSTPASSLVQIFLCMGWYLWNKRKHA
ncbi:MAG: MATE family efflux transporter [Oscillibacter sp.]|nr:MATE family efflux transporter [Oscillibacter sp.]